MGITGREGGGNREREEGRGLDRKDPIGQGPLSLPLAWSGLVASHGLSPSVSPLSSCKPSIAHHGVGMRTACWWIRPPLPAVFCPGLSQGGGRVGVLEEEDGSGWQGENLHVVRQWKKLENQLSILFSLPAKMWASCLGQQSQSRGWSQVSLASYQSLCSQRSLQCPSRGRLIHQRQGSFSSPLEITGSPRGFFLGLAQMVSQHLADSEVSCLSKGSATLGSGRKEADRGRGRASKAAKGVPEEVTSSQLALGPALGKNTTSSKVTPAES